MKSNLSRFIGCVLFVVLLFGAAGARAQSGIPRLISYQGLMVTQNQVPITGQHLVEVKYYDASSGGTVIGDETFRGVDFHNGVFDLSLGGAFTPPEFPARFTFAQPVWLAITLDPGSSSEQVFPRQELLSAPYAMNSERANGLQVTVQPVNGALWPVPVDGTGKIDASVLPAPTAGVTTLNAVGPDAGGGISLLPGNGISITPNANAHNITISRVGGIDTIVCGPGLSGGGTGPSVMLYIGPGQITSSMISPEAIYDDKIAPGTITASRLAPPGTYATTIAVGSTAQRPVSPVQGMIRLNTTTGKFEGYDGTAWVNLN